MDDGHRSILQQFNTLIIKDLEPEKILRHLERVLDPQDKAEIKAPPTREEKVEKLLDILPRRGNEAFSLFLEGLEKEQSWIAAYLKNAEEMKEVRTTSATLRSKLREADAQLEKEKMENRNLHKELEELRNGGSLVQNEHQMSHLLNEKVQEMWKTDHEKMKDYLECKFLNLEKFFESKTRDIKLHVVQANYFRKESVVQPEMSETISFSRRSSYKSIDAKEDGNLVDMTDKSKQSKEDHGNILELQEKIEELKLQCNLLKDENSFLKNKKLNSQDRSTSPMAKPLTENSQCKKCETLNTNYEKLLQENVEGKSEILELKKLTDKYEKETKFLEETLSIQKVLYDKTKKECIAFRNEIVDSKAEILELKELTDKYEKEKKTLEEKLSTLKSFYDKSKEDCVALKNEIENAVKQFRRLQKNYNNLENKKEKQSEKLKSLQLENEELREENEEALKNLKKKKDKNKEIIAELKRNLGEVQEECHELQAHLDRWKCLSGRIFNFNRDFDHNGVIYTLGTNFDLSPYINQGSNNNCPVTVTRSSQGKGHPMDILDNSCGKLSCTQNREGSWWQIDLGHDFMLFANHYTLRHGRDNGHSVIKNWNLEGSRDGRNWKILRQHKEAPKFKGGFYPYHTCSWPVEGEIEAMRYFRIRQTGKNWNGDYGLYLSGFEIYGILLFLPR